MRSIALVVVFLATRVAASVDCSSCYGLPEDKCAEKFAHILSFLPDVGHEHNRLEFFKLVQSKDYQFAFHEDDMKHEGAELSDEEFLATFEDALRRLMREDTGAVVQLFQGQCKTLEEWSVHKPDCCPEGLTTEECSSRLTTELKSLPPFVRLDILKLNVLGQDVPGCYEDSTFCIEERDAHFDDLSSYDRLTFLLDTCGMIRQNYKEHVSPIDPLVPPPSGPLMQDPDLPDFQLADFIYRMINEGMWNTLIRGL